MEFGTFSERVASEQDWDFMACRGGIERERNWEVS